MSPQPRAHTEVEELSLVAMVPGMARITATASVRLLGWTARAYVRAGSRLIRAAAARESPSDVLQQAGDDLLAYLRQLLAVTVDGDTAREHADEDAIIDAEVVEVDERPTRSELRERAAELLRRSADLQDAADEAHPAYARILAELAPDEARILRLMLLEGAQPSVDVRTGGPIGKLKDQLVAAGLNMIAMEGGLRRPELVHRHLDNLHRLGLIWFSREQLADQSRYQVLEAQPDVVEAMKEVRRTRTVRRSIHLTPFGEDFCRTCLPPETMPEPRG